LTLTHSHPDHAGGLAYLLERFAVKEVWDNGRIDYPEGIFRFQKRQILERGDVIESGQYTIQVLHPYPEFSTQEGDEYEEDNNSSLVIRISGKGHSFLFAGDIEEDAEDDLSHVGNGSGAM